MAARLSRSARRSQARLLLMERRASSPPDLIFRMACRQLRILRHRRRKHCPRLDLRLVAVHKKKSCGYHGQTDGPGLMLTSRPSLATVPASLIVVLPIVSVSASRETNPGSPPGPALWASVTLTTAGVPLEMTMVSPSLISSATVRLILSPTSALRDV